MLFQPYLVVGRIHFLAVIEPMMAASRQVGEPTTFKTSIQEFPLIQIHSGNFPFD